MNVYTESCLLVLDTYRNSFHCFAGLYTGVIVCIVYVIHIHTLRRVTLSNVILRESSPARDPVNGQ